MLIQKRKYFVSSHTLKTAFAQVRFILKFICNGLNNNLLSGLSENAKDPVEDSAGAVTGNNSTSQVPIVIVPGQFLHFA